jgi:ergothioneine biosynthesis protein EgtB
MSNHSLDRSRQLIEQYLSVRQLTTDICQSLEKEDLSVQPIADVSPPKWHLAHTTWFFEELLLVPYLQGFKKFNQQYSLLFNSYYKSAGDHWLQQDRGCLSRPTVNEILDYRGYIDNLVIQLLQQNNPEPEIQSILEIGLNHEQQHQELLYMDIKYILATNPTYPAYSNLPLAKSHGMKQSWKSFAEGLYHVGHEGEAFAYDNESPRHKHYTYPFKISDETVTNGEFLSFIDDKGYKSPNNWLSQGWDWVNSNSICKPLYWKQINGEWFEYTLHGLQPLDLDAPVVHVSYFEADAFATWKGARLPTEYEFEIYLQQTELKPGEKQATSQVAIYHPNNSSQKVGQVWCWTKSHYSGYPGYQTFKGVLEEYNGKFMCNQFVLKGGCVNTPKDHYRHTYRNFYQPHQRWMFSGIRLCKDH